MKSAQPTRIQPTRGEVWMADLEPVRGHEQGQKRPVLVISANAFNTSRADLVIVLPITSKEKHIRSHVLVKPQEGGLKQRSFIITEQVHCIAKERLAKRMGAISRETLALVETLLRVLLEL